MTLVWAPPDHAGTVQHDRHGLSFLACDVLKLDCGSLSLDKISTDRYDQGEGVRRYIDTLDRVGFASSVVNP